MKVHLILLAAGLSKRFKSKQNKILVDFNGKPLILYLLQTLINSGMFETITLTINNQDKEVLSKLISDDDSFSSVQFIEGGKTRHQSEERALQQLEEKGVDAEDLISIHDVARSFIDKELIIKLINVAKEYKSSVPAIKSRIIVDRASSLLLPDQGMYYLMQTPQTFLAKDLFSSYSKANDDQWAGVDTVECISKYTNTKAKIVEGTDLNMKITFPEDLKKIKRIVKNDDIKI